MNIIYNTCLLINDRMNTYPIYQSSSLLKHLLAHRFKKVFLLSFMRRGKELFFVLTHNDYLFGQLEYSCHPNLFRNLGM